MDPVAEGDAIAEDAEDDVPKGGKVVDELIEVTELKRSRDGEMSDEGWYEGGADWSEEDA